MAGAETERLTARDPLLQTVDLALTGTLYPLGFPVEVATNHEAVLECARDRWGDFPKLFSDRPVRLRVIVTGDSAGVPSPPSFRAREHLLSIVADRDNNAICDFRDGSATAWITPATAAEPGYLGYFLLDAMAYSILTCRHLTCLHAACVALGERGALLCGPSGMGKTSLAFACARRGLTFVSDDTASFYRKSKERIVIGRPARFRFRADAGSLLPELQGMPGGPDPKGKPTIEVRSSDLPDIRTAFTARVSALLFLDRRRSGGARLVPVSAHEARERIQQEIQLLDLESYREQCASLDILLDVPLLRLEYSTLPDAAERVIDALQVDP